MATRVDIARRLRSPTLITDAVVARAIEAWEREKSLCEMSDTLPEVVGFYDPRPWRAAIETAIGLVHP